ncbi:MAG: polysaccharide pyruvyl transferase family protein [Planctomycetes bacterium]|nr:polysaccharide pyruvyl transferase family protein [Planctomycetota bacterium]
MFSYLSIDYKLSTEDIRCHPDISSLSNIGDAIQNLAVENIYRKVGVETASLGRINRAEIADYHGPKCIVPMQGWFRIEEGLPCFPWSRSIIPVFIGFHLSTHRSTRELFIRHGYHNLFAPYEPIGCRDRDTVAFLESFGVQAYFSGCLTLTFDKRPTTPKDGRVYAVDLHEKIVDALPPSIRRDADFSLTHKFSFSAYPIPPDEVAQFEQAARNILATYRESASLVITSRIHVAMPCIAMGIPVVFITRDVGDERFDVLKGIVPLYSIRNMSSVNWRPKAPDIDSLKEAIIHNAIAQIRFAENGGVDRLSAIEKLSALTNRLEDIYPTHGIMIKRKALSALANLVPNKKFRRKIKRIG